LDKFEKNRSILTAAFAKAAQATFNLDHLFFDGADSVESYRFVRLKKKKAARNGGLKDARSGFATTRSRRTKIAIKQFLCS